MGQGEARVMSGFKKYSPREYSLFTTNAGVVLCDNQDGAFLVLRFPEDLERLKALLATIDAKML